MADHPILFSTPMIRALIEGRKTQTRRIFKGIEQNQNGTWHIFNAGGGVAGVAEADVGKEAPDYLRIQVGDRLWVREAWRCNGWATDVATIFYRASEGNGYSAMCEQYPVADKKPMRVTSTWRPGIHMPRWASRLTLLVTDVRVERLQDISEQNAKAEGATAKPDCFGTGLDRDGWSMDWSVVDEHGPWECDIALGDPQSAFLNYFYKINDYAGKYGDDPETWPNPFVAAYTFRVIKSNIDQIGGDA